MSVSSMGFVLASLIILVLYYGPLRRLRWQFLLTVSLAMYTLSGVVFLLLAVGLALGNYLVANHVYHLPDKPARRPWFILAIIVNLTALAAFKYFVGVNAWVAGLLPEAIGGYQLPFTQLMIPLGISYYTFKHIGHQIEMYRHKGEPVAGFGRYLLFTLFFPSVSAGPIDRANRFLPQLDSPDCSAENVNLGLTLVVWGLFKKIVIADSLAVIVGAIYGNAESFTGIPLIIGTWAFAYQIYCDFSGYTDIARGTALMLGIRLEENFNRPYVSRTVTEFWQRWHMSLSFWLRDYIFLPLAYAVSRRVNANRLLGVSNEMWSYSVAIIITWLIGGLWHDNAWPMIVWGGLQGVYLMLDRATLKTRKRINKKLRQRPVRRTAYHWLQAVITFNLISLSWIFFRSETMHKALYILTHLFQVVPKLSGFGTGVANSRYLHLLVYIAFMEIVQKLATVESVRAAFAKPAVRFASLLILSLMIVFLGEFGDSVFVYAKF
ncbi:MAG: hypothetical protein K8R90_05580 [Candidatus Cloacimonetes bacterium]|nr:hypothetical protein [Candidatus Cloacimonadota bacterium]